MKKIMVVSDTHKHHRNLARALEQAGTPDLLIHLGDAEGYEDYIADMAGCPLEIVSGNNDFFSMLDKEKEIRIGKYKAHTWTLLLCQCGTGHTAQRSL